jgi:protein TonB
MPLKTTKPGLASNRLGRRLSAEVLALVTALFIVGGAAHAADQESPEASTVSDRVERDIVQIRRHVWEGNLERAERGVQRALERDLTALDRAALLIERSEIQTRRGAFSAALDDLIEVLDLDALPSPMQARLQLEIAELYAALGEYSSAVEAFETGFRNGARTAPDSLSTIGLVYLLAADGAVNPDQRFALLQRGLQFAELAAQHEDARSETSISLALAFYSRLSQYEPAQVMAAQWVQDYPNSQRASAARQEIEAAPPECWAEESAAETQCDWTFEPPPLWDVLQLTNEPAFRYPPSYPPRAAQRGLEGDCTVIFDVTPEGLPNSIRPTADCDRAFQAATIAAVERWRYAPLFQEGVPVWRRDVVTTLTFELD